MRPSESKLVCEKSEILGWSSVIWHKVETTLMPNIRYGKPESLRTFHTHNHTGPTVSVRCSVTIFAQRSRNSGALATTKFHNYDDQRERKNTQRYLKLITTRKLTKVKRERKKNTFFEKCVGNKKKKTQNTRSISLVIQPLHFTII